MPGFLMVALLIAAIIVAGLVVAGIRRANVGAAMDPVAEIRDAEASLRRTLATLPAAGVPDADLREKTFLLAQLPAIDADHGKLSPMELDIKLLELISWSVRATALADQYAAAELDDGDASGADEETSLLVAEAAARPRRSAPPLHASSV